MFISLAKLYYSFLNWLYKVEKPCERIGLKWLWYEYTRLIYETANFMALVSRQSLFLLEETMSEMDMACAKLAILIKNPMAVARYESKADPWKKILSSKGHKTVPVRRNV